ncbi:MAG: metalloprotease [Hyphomicrobiaceae bacterium]
MPVHRREVLIGGLLTAIWMPMESHASCRPPGQAARRALGCVVSDTDVRRYMTNTTDTIHRITGNEPIILRSGDPLFDRALAVTLLKMTNMFDVLPGFGYFQEPGNEVNAVAMPWVRMQNPDGTVLFGKNLLASFRALPEHPEVAVTAVCAHEWGHILQYKRNLQERLCRNSTTVKPMELHADFLAGYFAGMRRIERSGYPAAVVALALHKLGDSDVTGQGHHGTREERGAAVVAGFNAAYRDKKTFNEAVEIGIAMARSKI